MPPKIVRTPESVAKIVRAYGSAQKNTNDLARELGVAVNTIRDLLLAHGVQLTNGLRVMSRKRAGRPSVRMGANHSEEAKRKNDPARWKDDYRRIYLSVDGAEPEVVPDW